MSQVVLITGASSGIGLETAKQLVAKGYSVYGTSRKPQAHPNLPFKLLPLDVNDAASVKRCVQEVLSDAGKLDVLINNAGYDLYGAAEETTVEELRAQLETNFFGAVEVTKAVMGVMRERGAGKIINVSSIGGLIALPYNSAYAASKFALEGYTEALRYELLPFNVYVSLIEPGQVHTSSLDTSVRLNAAPHPAYNNAARTLMRKIVQGAQETGLAPQTVANVTVRAAQQPKPKLRYLVGNTARFVPVFKVLLPGMFERFVRRQFGSGLVKLSPR